MRPKTALGFKFDDAENLTEGPLKDELRILTTEAFLANDMTLSAQAFLTDVAGRSIGTTQSAWALSLLEKLAAGNEVDEGSIEEFAYEFDGSVDGPAERSMLSWFRAKALARRGYSDWSLKELDRVSTDSSWSAERIFDRATDLMVDDRTEEAESIYDMLAKRTAIRAPTKQFVELNKARLVFERGNYDQTISMIKHVQLPLRERTRAILEMAWSRYYLREYGRALGLLSVLDSAFYQSLRSPEADLLRMVIQRDLCRYDLVKQSTAAFRERYKSTFKVIESRLPLEQDSTIKQIALQGRHLQKLATLIHRYRTELATLADEDVAMVPGGRDELQKAMGLRMRKVEDEIDRTISRDLERVASRFVEWRDQVTFLEYEASIRPLTAAPKEEADYQAEKASKTRFEKLYWPISNESWWDELETYEVLISGHCQAPPSPMPMDMRSKAAPTAKPSKLSKPKPTKAKAPLKKAKPVEEDTSDDEEDDDE